MSRNNDVFSVLVTTGNLTVLPKDQKFDTLAIGQIGVFNADTHLSMDATSVPVQEFYIAIGMDRDGDTVLDGMKVSAGPAIQSRNIRSYSARPHTAGRPMIFTLSGYSADCDTEYALKVEFRNQEIYRRQGYNQYTKTYTLQTDCCEGCVDCPSGDGNDITNKLVTEINLDEDGLLTAVAIAADIITIATHGTAANYSVGDEMTAADVAQLIVFNAAQPDDTTKVYSSVKVTSVDLGIKTFCSVNTNYFNPRGTIMLPSLVEGFECNGTLTTTQTIVFEEGNGYDVKQREYHAMAWDSAQGPYKVNQATGLASDGFEFNATVAEKYDRIALTYDHLSIAGWQEHLNNCATEVFIPEASTVTLAAFLAVIDAIITPLGLDPLADDIAAASVNPAVIEKTEDAATQDLDGLA